MNQYDEPDEDQFRHLNPKIVYHHQGWIFKRLAAIIIAFGVIPYLLVKYLPELNEWLDKTMDKGDQMRTGIVILLIGSFSLGVLFLTTLKRR